MTRFICAVVMHISLSDSLELGMRMMKYSINHSWKFTSWKLSFFAGLMQIITIVLVELTTILVILATNDPLDIVMNFMALVVISDFGTFFYSGLGTNSQWKEIITEDIYADMLKV